MALRAEADALMARIDQWSRSCPTNFAHKDRLVRAIAEHTSGNTPGAISLLADAAEAAAASGFVQHEALAHELAAQIHDADGDQAAVRHEVEAALDAYARWGAMAKVADVRDQFPALLS